MRRADVLLTLEDSNEMPTLSSEDATVSRSSFESSVSSDSSVGGHWDTQGVGIWVVLCLCE